MIILVFILIVPMLIGVCIVNMISGAVYGFVVTLKILGRIVRKVIN